MHPRLVVLSGPPATGKSTVAQALTKLVGDSALYLNPDALVYGPDGTYNWTPSIVGEAWGKTWEAFGSWNAKLHQKYSLLIFDAMLLTPTARGHVIHTPKGSFISGLKVVSLTISTPLELCIQRNNKRSVDRRVPEDKLLRFYETFVLNKPTINEGFDEIIQLSGHDCGIYSCNDCMSKLNRAAGTS